MEEERNNMGVDLKKESCNSVAVQCGTPTSL
jgi:hypothetical protein